MTNQTNPQRPIRRIACIGEVMIELIADESETASLNVAGDTYNTAVYLAQLLQGTDVSVSYVTALGEDRFSDRILAHMARYGVGSDVVERRADKMPGLYAIETDAAGERSFTYWRSDSAARTLFSDPCAVSVDILGQFDLVFLSGITLAILPQHTRDRLFAALDAFRAAGGLVAYDSNHRPRLWETPETAREINTAMWARTDIALPSADDEMLIFEEGSPDNVLRRLRAAGLALGALKRGDAGPKALSETEADQVFDPVTSVVDTTAAGDSFNAGYLAEIARGNTVHDALRAGHALASHVIQHKGAIVPI